MTAAKKKMPPTVDDLARTWGAFMEQEQTPHAEIVASARKRVQETRAALDAWLGAIEDPLNLGSFAAADGAAEALLSDDDDNLIDKGLAFVYAVHNGAALRSTKGKLVECQGEIGKMVCGSAVAVGHKLCVMCEARDERPSVTP